MHLNTLRKFSKKLSLQTEVSKITFRGTPIQTYTIGTGEKVVFSFPAYPHSGLIYLRFLEQYPDSNVKFITFDLPGWVGLSENLFQSSEFTMSECVNIALKILAENKIEKYNLIGYSFGTALATMLTHFDRDRVDRLVLVSPVVNCRLLTDSWNMKKVNLAKTLGIPVLVKNYVKYRFWLYKKYLRSSGFQEEFVQEYQKFLEAADGKVLLDSIYKLFHDDLTVYLDHIKDKKIMVVNSTDETQMFKDQAEFIRRTLDDEKSLFVNGSHEDFVLKGDPAAAKQVLQFLAE